MTTEEIRPVLEYDRWVEKPRSEWKDGDFVAVGDQVLRFNAKDSSTKEGRIVIDIADNPLTRLMERLDASILVFDDGTAMLYSYTKLLSPRLKESELLPYCEKHKAQYDALAKVINDYYNEDNGSDKTWVEVFTFKPWWAPVHQLA